MPDEFTPNEKQIIIQNLENFPQIDQVINKDRNFFRKYNARDYQHIPECERDNCLEFTFANILKNMPYFLKILQRLEKIISYIPPDSRTKFGKKLSQELDFFGTFSEIEVYYHLLRRGKKPILEPKISLNENSIDLGFYHSGKFFLVEIKTPQMSTLINDYINSLPTDESDPDIRSGTGYIDETNQLFIDATRISPTINTDFRGYPRESSRIERLILEDFIGGNLRDIDNPLSIPIILIINYERARSMITFYYDVLEMVKSLMRENPPTKVQGILTYPPPLPVDNNSTFFQNPNYDFSFDEIQFFSSLMKTEI